MGEGWEGGNKVGEKNGRVGEAVNKIQSRLGLNVYYVVVHNATVYEASLSIVDSGLCARGEGGLKGGGNDFAIGVGEGEGPEGGRRSGKLGKW